MITTDRQDELIQRIMKGNEMRPIIERIRTPESDWDRFAALREMYAEIDTGEWDPYPFDVDWLSVFTPIEFMVWQDIRSIGIHMWPQYPVGRYFLDFANPQKRIAIEADGKDWHDSKRDYERDKELAHDGWRIFRVSGSDCVRIPKWDDEDMLERIREYAPDRPPELEDWHRNTSTALVEAIRVFYYDQSSWLMTWDEAARIMARRMLYQMDLIDPWADEVY